jgi:hypothetical protein
MSEWSIGCSAFHPKIDLAKHRRLGVGEVVQDGDLFVYNNGQTSLYVRRCKYDPGCCVGHIVEAGEDYYRVLR